MRVGETRFNGAPALAPFVTFPQHWGASELLRPPHGKIRPNLLFFLTKVVLIAFQRPMHLHSFRVLNAYPEVQRGSPVDASGNLNDAVISGDSSTASECS
jgi:hypothetical protein